MKKWFPAVAAIVVLAVLIGWRIREKQADQASQLRGRDMRRNAPAVVSVAPAARRDIVQTFDTVGNVESPIVAKLAPKVGGRIDYLQVREGDPVSRGQVLVRIDPSEVQAQVNQQEAMLAEARYRLAQAQTTRNATNVSIASQVQQQAAVLNVANATYNQARQTYASQVAAAQASVTDAQAKVAAADAAVTNAKAAVGSAQASLRNAQAKYERIRDLYRQGFTAAQDVDDASTTVQVQEAQLNVAKGQQSGAQSMADSARAQLRSAQQQASIVATKGKTDIEAARAQVRQARATLATARANTAQGPANAQNIEALKAGVDAAAAQVRNAQAQLANTIITSPIDGAVTARNADPGSQASPSQPVLEVQAFRQVYVNVPVPEGTSRRIFAGMPAQMRFDALPGRVFVGKVKQVNPAADPASRQFMVQILLDNPTGAVRPGMYARVSIVTERRRNLLVVPREAIQQQGSETVVFAVGPDDKAVAVPVATGPGDANGVSISSGLKDGDKVVTLSANPVRDGQSLRIAGQGQPRRKR